MPSSKPRSPWKVLLLALLGCTVCFVLAVGGVVYWFLSIKRVHEVEFAADRGEEVEVESRLRVVETNFPPRQVAEPSAPKEQVAAENAIVGRSPSTIVGTTPGAGDDIFRDVVIPEIEIQIPTTATVRLTMKERSYVPVTIREGNRIYTNVALRLKGGPGSFQSLHSTPSFTINFDKFAEGQTFHGLKKIHLNSSVQDDTRLNEKISRELFETAGVPVPRAGHAIVTINRRDPRLYVLVEGVNKQFLKRWFKDAKGNVYDGHSGTDVTHGLKINTGEEPRDRLEDLADAARERNLEQRLAKLEQTLDLDRFLSFVALEMMVSHWDGYTQGRNNFRIAHNRDSDRMVFIPQGMDQLFGRNRQPLLSPNPEGLVAKSVLQIPELRKRYQNRLAELTTNVFRVAVLTNRICQVVEKIATALDPVDPDAAKAYRQNIGPRVLKRVRQHATYLAHEIRVAPQQSPLKFDPSGDALLAKWFPKVDTGEAQVTEEKDDRGNALLHIGTSSRCTASWRATAVLDSGKYRLEARIKTREVVFDPNDPRDGAGLRISGHRTGQKNAGDNDWKPIYFDFNVQEDGTEKELVCELRANQGEIWYDLRSIKLKRL